MSIDTSSKHEVDVVVVGAGAAGLQAAHKLQEEGLSYALLEANSQVGGKIRSASASNTGGVVDLGAAWVNDTTQSHVYELVKRYGLTVVPQNTTGVESFTLADGKHETSVYGSFPTDGEGNESAINDFFGHINKLIEQLEATDIYSSDLAKQLDSVNVEQFCTQLSNDPQVQFGAILACRALLGVEPSEVSALYLVHYMRSGTGPQNLISEIKDGAQYLRIAEGMSRVVEGIARELDDKNIFLNCPVKSIDQTTLNKCIVKSDNGKIFQAKKVLLTVPTPLWSRIEFSPPLPSLKLQYSENAILGAWSKTVFVFEEPWWREVGHMGAMHWANGFATLARDTSSNDHGQYSLTCFIIGEPAREWSSTPPALRRKQVLQQLKDTFKHFDKEVPEPINTLEIDWLKEPWFNGAPCPLVGPGILSSGAGKEVFRPWRDLHFIGTETSDIWQGYVDGALRSAVRGVEEVKASL